MRVRHANNTTTALAKEEGKRRQLLKGQLRRQPRNVHNVNQILKKVGAAIT